MADTWITDLRHFLDEYGEFADELPVSALKLAQFQCSIVGWVTAAEPGRNSRTRTNVHCRRSPRHRPCRGEIFATLEDRSASIVWDCPLCGDNGQISGWEGTTWDRRLPDA